ncbi:ThuA domain-containing protein [Haloferula chungangensis]|uniref:ThuA domain-containing protein n=1 Tax=Haloferula chungangensis TaxID=1048331 RepID=A0ABW2L856_9BACT
MKKLLLILAVFVPAHISPVHAEEDTRPHVVFVVGPPHYSPELTMPVFAKELERLGLRTTIVSGDAQSEKKTENVLPGIKALEDADLAIFFMRFLNLPDAEWQPIEDYLKSGKPVIGLRTASHAFRYPKGHPRAHWNDDFGARALGSPYIVHQSGTTKIEVIAEHADHPIMANVEDKEWVSQGTLYLAHLGKGAVPLVKGTGKGRSRVMKKSFGTFEVKETETAPVAWAWENEWGGKVFGSSFGHPGDFGEPAFTRMLVNAVFWSLDRPVPPAEEKIRTWQIERADKKPKK